MTTRVIDQLIQRLARAESFLGFNPIDVEQGSDDWFTMRLGVATASRSHKLVAKAGSATRKGLINELVAEICTGIPNEQMSLRAMEWGKENEAAARSTLSFAIGQDIHEIAFVYREVDGIIKRGFGCSPDGITEDGYGVELKCPFITTNHVDFILNKQIKREYIYQVQFSLWVTGLKGWYFGSFDPRMRTKMLDYVLVEPDPKLHKQFDDAAASFELDLRKSVADCGEAWPWQESDEKPEQAQQSFADSV